MQEISTNEFYLPELIFHLVFIMKLYFSASYTRYRWSWNS